MRKFCLFFHSFASFQQYSKVASKVSTPSFFIKVNVPSTSVELNRLRRIKTFPENSILSRSFICTFVVPFYLHYFFHITGTSIIKLFCFVFTFVVLCLFSLIPLLFHFHYHCFIYIFVVSFVTSLYCFYFYCFICICGFVSIYVVSFIISSYPLRWCIDKTRKNFLPHYGHICKE